MLSNWSVILNVLLLVGVIIAIARTVKSRHEKLRYHDAPPIVSHHENIPCDDIIAVRKVSRDASIEAPTINPAQHVVVEGRDTYKTPARHVNAASDELSSLSVVIFLLAKEDRQLAGYELLQTLLSAGLRFGEEQIFHRHQFSNGKGPVLCSGATATSTGTFDLQNIGAFSVHGLCVYMEASGSSAIDEERFAIMLETARQLSDDLGTYLLDDRRQPLTETTLKRYYQKLNLNVPNKEEVA